MSGMAASANKQPRSFTTLLEKTGSAWIVVITNPKAEKTTKAAVEAHQLEVYLPMRLGKHRFGGTVSMPLFPRHLFVRVTRATQAWQRLFTTPGVARVLCSAQRPIALREEFIERVREVELRGLSVLGLEEARATPAFKRGDRVETLDGLIKGIFQEEVDDRRVAILVSLLGGDSRLATVDLRKLAHPQSVED